MAYQDIISSFQEQQEAARLSNEQRYAQALELYDQIISTYQPEGGFLKGAEAELEREKGRTLAGQKQDLVSSGLFGTSVTAGLGQKWESEVGMPARLKLEDVRMGRLAESIGAKAGVLERREDVGPDYATIAAMSAQMASGPQRTGGRVSTGGGQGSTRPSALSPSTGPTDIWGNPISGGTGGGGQGFGGVRPQYQYFEGPAGGTQEALQMSSSGATYMGGGDWRRSGELAEAHAAASGYGTPQDYISPWGLPSPYEDVGNMTKKYSYNPYQ